jgi:acetyl esterase
MTNQSVKPILDPVVQKFLDDLAKKGGTPIYRLSVEDARKALFDLQEAWYVEPLPANIDEMDFPGGPNGKIAVRIVRPKGVTQKLPVIIYMHGGGWVLGDKEIFARLISELANGAQAAVVFVNYQRAPEKTYPSAHEEGYAVAKWVAENGEKLNLDITRMAIAGDSVGGLMATAIAMMAKERGGPQFVFQLLFYPVTDAGMNTPSYEQFATGYFLERAGMKWFWDAYVPDTSMRLNPLVAPLNATLDQLKNLPPAFVMVNECDVLRDEGEAYAQNLMAAGVPVVLERYSGLIHDSVMLNGITQAPEVRVAIDQAVHMLKHAFEAKK